MDAAAHLTCVARRRAMRSTLWCAATRKRASAASWRCAAIRRRASASRSPRIPRATGIAAELVAGIRKIGDFDISVAAYPEKHPQSPSWGSDIDNLKRKLDAGATRAITQMFFDNDDYFRFVDRARAAGITAPIVPGIQPIHSFKQISGFAARCGASIPGWVADRFEGLDEDPETHALVASAVAAEQVLELVDNGITEFHFYTLNRSNLVLGAGSAVSATGRIDPGTVQRAFRVRSGNVHARGKSVATTWPLSRVGFPCGWTGPLLKDSRQ